MENYKVVSIHEVYLDSFKDGEQENVNNYTLESDLNADNPLEAIKNYYENFLFYKFDKENLTLSNSEDSLELEKNTIYDCKLVDNENVEAGTNQISMWKKNKLKLYSNNISIKVYKLTECKIIL